MHLITLILGLMLLPTGHGLKCYECIPGPTGTCTETQKQCPGSDKCGAVTIRSYVGDMKMDVKTKHCTDLCITGSVTIGFTMLSECCTTDLCNVQYPTPPVNPSPNGKKCYTCQGDDCSHILPCTGDEDRCLAGKGVMGGKDINAKGCASKGMCVSSAIIPGVMNTEASCCEGDLCNGDASSAVIATSAATTAVTATDATTTAVTGTDATPTAVIDTSAASIPTSMAVNATSATSPIVSATSTTVSATGRATSSAISLLFLVAPVVSVVMLN